LKASYLQNHLSTNKQPCFEVGYSVEESCDDFEDLLNSSSRYTQIKDRTSWLVPDKIMRSDTLDNKTHLVSPTGTAQTNILDKSNKKLDKRICWRLDELRYDDMDSMGALTKLIKSKRK
jgi:hypothetical protein